MELYPIIEPIINYTKSKASSIHTGTKKVAKDLTLFAKNKARRMLSNGDTNGGNGGSNGNNGGSGNGNGSTDT